MSRCDDCGRPLYWGGTSGYLPHDDEYHAELRARLLRVLRERLLSRAGAAAGHRVRIRFTASTAWAECPPCGWRSLAMSNSFFVREPGHLHLAEAGRAALRRARIFTALADGDDTALFAALLGATTEELRRIGAS